VELIFEEYKIRVKYGNNIGAKLLKTDIERRFYNESIVMNAFYIHT
jgi:hypothetical protein